MKKKTVQILFTALLTSFVVGCSNSQEEAEISNNSTDVKGISTEEEIKEPIPVEVLDPIIGEDILNQQILEIRFKNIADDAIKNIDFYVFAYDEDGYPIKVQFGNKGYMLCNYDSTIKPNEMSESGIYYNFYNNTGEISKVKIVIDKVEFYEKDSWVNKETSQEIKKLEGNKLPE